MMLAACSVMAVPRRMLHNQIEDVPSDKPSLSPERMSQLAVFADQLVKEGEDKAWAALEAETSPRFDASGMEMERGGDSLLDSMKKCREMPKLSLACVNAVHCAWAHSMEPLCSRGHNKPGLYSFLAPRNGDVDRSQGIIVDDPASVAAFAKDYEQCKKNPDRLIYEPVDSEGRVWLFESTLFICPAKEGKAFMLDETKNEYLQEWGQPNCGKKVTYVPVRHIKSSKYGSKSSSSSTTDPAFDYRVKIVLEKEATWPMSSAPDQHGGGGGKHKAWLTKLTKNRFSSDDKKILIGCGLLRDNDGSAEKSKSDKKELFKACKNQAEKLSDAINAATKYANGGKSSDTDKYSKLASLIENVADESRGALMNVVGAQASGTGLTGFTQGYMTTPTIGQGGQIGGAFEESDSLGSPERNKLFAAALSCATGVAMTLVTAGAGAGVGLGMASSCVMLLGRGIKAIMEFFVGKGPCKQAPPWARESGRRPHMAQGAPRAPNSSHRRLQEGSCAAPA